ncbi:uncharacterized protein LOC111262719 isoform X2 [Varroa jacobsoni]|uniref:Uncharacterized protein n=1 Tax=Varroa destructor TaxID=109461 RepID=A0A7M7KVV4_VARDE|nr:uncharacterized protein LOC111254670 isoform X2 [Varroa destructor]XP_022692938.1 uncharacterized protein LOC111262719 isoform X2 [Varroa jacobsoni]
MPQNGLPDEMSSLVINSGEKIWINLYPNALCNVKKSLKGHLDERIGKFCDKNGGILLSYTDLKFRAKHFQVFEDYPMCRFPVSITATYYKPEPGTIATGTITRVDHISVTCLIHGMIHVMIALRKSVNFDTWCALGQQIIFQIRGGEMHYKGVRLNAIVTEECVDRMRIAFPPDSVGSRKRTFSSSSADSSMTTPNKQFKGERSVMHLNIPSKSLKRRKSGYIDLEDQLSYTDACSLDACEDEVNSIDGSLDFGTPGLTSTQLRQNKRMRYKDDKIDPDNEELKTLVGDGNNLLGPKRIKVEYSSQEETTPFQCSKIQKRRAQ